MLLFHLLDFRQSFFLGVHRPDAADETGLLFHEFRFAKLGGYQILVQSSALPDDIFPESAVEDSVHDGLDLDALRGVVHFFDLCAVM